MNDKIAALAVGLLLVFLVWYSLTRLNVRDGKTIFIEEGCVKCHVIRGIGQGKIDLTGVTRRRSDTWIREHIKTPRIHNPNIGMPSFAYLSKGEVDSLVQFLRQTDRGSS